MHRNAYLLLFCIIILGVVNISEFKNAKIALGQAQINELVSDSGNVVNVLSAEQINEMPKNVLEAGVDNVLEDVLVETTNVLATSGEVSSVPVPKKTIKSYISAEEYLVGNLETGEIYLKLNENKVFPIASVSKLYTALVVRHLFDPESRITITSEMLKAYGTAGNLKVDESYTPDELLHALLMESSNDAAEAYAYTYGYEKFIGEMNAFAKEIGMHNTSFKDSSGLSAQNISNAKDLFALAKYLYKSEPDILEISRQTSTTIRENAHHISHNLVNINPFSKNPNFIGGKTGRTDQAKESMVSLFNKSVNGVDYPIAVIVLRSDFGERETNTEKLVNMFVDSLTKNN